MDQLEGHTGHLGENATWLPDWVLICSLLVEAVLQSFWQGHSSLGFVAPIWKLPYFDIEHL